jgi:hypothetical protein
MVGLLIGTVYGAVKLAICHELRMASSTNTETLIVGHVVEATCESSLWADCLGTHGSLRTAHN